LRISSTIRAAAITVCVLIACVTAGCTASHSNSNSPSAVTLREIDGGPAYFSRINRNSAWMDDHILLGAWLEQPANATEVGYDRATGDNIYWSLAGTGSVCGGAPCVASYQTIRKGGMHVSAPSEAADSGSESVAYEGTDEPDMNFGPGWDSWNRAADSCVPAGGKCGYTVAHFFYAGKPASLGSLDYPADGTVKQQGYGKGVLFWETSKQAAEFLKFSDILSADSYWMTDSSLGLPSEGGCAFFPDNPVICDNGSGKGLTRAQRQLPANYAYNVTELEKLQARNGSSKPIVVDIETGCPFVNSDSCTTPDAMTAAAWHALIAGARGIIWFQHNFGGPCIDFRTIIDGSNPASHPYNCQQSPNVTLHQMVTVLTQFNSRVNCLNIVLLSPFADGYVHSGNDVSYMAKHSDGKFYIFAASGKPGVPPPSNQKVTFSIARAHNCRVTVLYEHRSIPVVNGKFSDLFKGIDSVHIYRVEC
jgi:hypothetical protein